MEAFDLGKLSQILGQKLDAKTKFKLMDMIDQRPVITFDHIDPDKNQLTYEKLKQLCDDQIDYIIDDHMFHNAELLLQSRNEALQAADEGFLKEAGYGRGHDYAKDSKVRGDLFIWLSSLSKDASLMKQNQE